MTDYLPIAMGLTPPAAKKKYNPDSFIGPGGEELNEQKYRRGVLRADLCELAARVSFNHGPRIVDAILARYEVSRKL